MKRTRSSSTILDGRLRFERRGLPWQPFDDSYHAILLSSWTAFFGGTIALYATINVLFAWLYIWGGDCINAANPGSFLDSFSFSVQTLSTIGYGTMSPTTPWAHAVVFVESFVGLIGVALVTGLCFAKFTRPQARVTFSGPVVIQRRNSRPALSFRMANERNSRIVDAHCQLYVLVDEVTSEGEEMRRFYPLHLERDRSPIFLLTWSVFHYLDGNSPLAGITEATVSQRMVALIAIVMGTDEGFVQNVYAQHHYSPDDMRFGHRFVDLIGGQMESLIIHHDRLHATVPAAQAAVTDAEPEETSP